MNKKGQLNDVTYILMIFIVMITVAVALPFIQRDIISGSGNSNFNSTVTANNPILVDSDDLSVVTPLSILGSLDIIASIGKMFFWYFGELPLILNMFFLILKTVFWVLIYRLIRSGGG